MKIATTPSGKSVQRLDSLEVSNDKWSPEVSLNVAGYKLENVQSVRSPEFTKSPTQESGRARGSCFIIQTALLCPQRTREGPTPYRRPKNFSQVQHCTT